MYVCLFIVISTSKQILQTVNELEQVLLVCKHMVLKFVENSKTSVWGQKKSFKPKIFLFEQVGIIGANLYFKTSKIVLKS